MGQVRKCGKLADPRLQIGYRFENRCLDIDSLDEIARIGGRSAKATNAGDDIDRRVRRRNGHVDGGHWVIRRTPDVKGQPLLIVHYKLLTDKVDCRPLTR
jgi:hypothetical protein